MRPSALIVGLKTRLSGYRIQVPDITIILAGLQYLMLAPFTVGTILTWTGLMGSVFNFQQFACGTALLILGGVHPTVRSFELLRAATRQDGEGNFVSPPIVRIRQLLVAAVAFVNVAANVVCVVMVVLHHITGRLPWTGPDKLLLVAGAFIGLILLLLWQSGTITRLQFMFGLSVSWRAFVIGAAAVLPVLVALDLYVTNEPLLPKEAAIGMLLIACQAAIVMLIERADIGIRARRQPDNPQLQEARQRFRWNFSSELFNVAACSLLAFGTVGAAMMMA